MPRAEITAHILDIAKGNLDAKIEAGGGGELSALISAVNTMAEALKASFDEQYFRTMQARSIISSLRDGVLVVDRAGTITQVNDAAGRLLGYAEPELINQPLGKYLPESGFAAAIQSGDDLSPLFRNEIEGIVHTKTAEEIPVSFSGAVIPQAIALPRPQSVSSKPQDSLIVITIRDLRGQKKAEHKREEALRYFEASYKNLAAEIKARTLESAQAQEAMLNILEDLNEAKNTLEISRKNFLNIVTKSTDSILIVDREGIVHFINPSAIALFDRAEKEIIGRQFGYSITENRTTEINIPRTGQDPRIARMRAVETEWEQQAMRLVLLQDISEQKKAEATLMHSAQEWRATFDAISDSVSLLDREGTVLRCNKALRDVLDKEFSDIIGHNSHDFLPGADTEAERCIICRAMATKKGETKVLARNKQWMRIAVDPLLSDNDVAGAVHMYEYQRAKLIEQKLWDIPRLWKSIP